jgi:hypothetical protein
MPWTIGVPNGKDLVEIRVWQDVTVEDMRESLSQIDALSEEHATGKVLIDARELKAMPRTMSLFDFGRQLAETPFSRPMRFALVPSSSVREDVAFLETVSRNRGVEARAFPSREAALEWLSAEE